MEWVWIGIAFVYAYLANRNEKRGEKSWAQTYLIMMIAAIAISVIYART